MHFHLLATDKQARRGRLIFDRGSIETPAFMPVGTQGAVKALTPAQLDEAGAQVFPTGGTRVLVSFNRDLEPASVQPGAFSIIDMTRAISVSSRSLSVMTSQLTIVPMYLPVSVIAV